VGLELAGGGVGKVRAVEGEDAPGGFIEADHGFAEGGFTAAGFADEAEGFAGLERQGDVIDGFDAAGGALEDAGFDGKVEAEVFGSEERRRRRRRRRRRGKWGNVER
jgi:hypothetical protein